MGIRLLLAGVPGMKTRHSLLDERGGVDKLAGPVHPSAEAFWENVQGQIVVLSRQKRLFPTKVILGGENAEFLGVPKDALREVQVQDPKLT